MDDVDAVQAEIASNMLTSGDWVTARLDGVIYLEKPPLIYWPMAVSYKIFGVQIGPRGFPCALCHRSRSADRRVRHVGVWQTRRILCRSGMSTCVGLFLFTRIQIPDVMLTFTIALAMWSFLRALDEEENTPRLWAAFLPPVLASALLKSLIGIVFPVAAGADLSLLSPDSSFLREPGSDCIRSAAP